MVWFPGGYALGRLAGADAGKGQRRMRLEFTEDRFVIFADILGFASLTEAHAGSIAQLRPTFRADEDIILWTDDTYPGDNDGATPPNRGAAGLLERRFTAFHLCVTGAIRRLQQAGEGSAVVFSDSVFLEYPTAVAAMRGAMSLMRNRIDQGVPVRMGVGFGSFRVLRFFNDSSSATAIQGAQFVGTAVVRSCAAESCGAKGMRILLHPSAAEPLLQDSVCCEVVLPLSEPVGVVQHEINYAAHPSEIRGFNLDKSMFKTVAELCAETSVEHSKHYFATFLALNRMRQQRGRKPFPVPDHPV